MLQYRPFSFRTPWWMDAAQRLNAATALLVAIALPVGAWLRWRRRGAAAG
jgi:hypothetical protein